MRIFSTLFARAVACATSGALLAIVGVLALCATPVFGQNGSRSWTGNTSTDFYDGDNWSAAGNYPNGNVTFVDSALTGSANTTINRTSGTYSYIYGLYFNNTLNTENIYTINGSTKVFLGGSVVRTSAVTGGSLTDVINANFQQAGAAEVFNLGQNHHLDVNGVISGSNTFTKSGLGTLTLSGTNTYTGNTTISAGTLSVTGAGSLRSGTYAGAIANNGILTLDTSAAQTLSGVISGTGALTKSSTGTLTLSGQNTYTGGTTVNAGTLDLVGQQRIDGALIVDGTGIVKLSGTGHNAYHGISSVTIQNGGTFTDNTTGSRVQSVNSAVTFTNGGTMTSEAGANGLGEFGNFLFISGINVTGTGLATINSSGMSFNYGETVTVADSVAGSGTDLLVSAVIRNERVGTNIKAGVGTMEMTAVNTDTSDWSITGGTLKVGGAGQLQSGSYAGAVANSGTFEYNSSANQTMSGVISGTGALTKSNTGTLTLTSGNSYAGGTIVNAGTLKIDVAGRIGNGGLTVNNGGTFSVTNADYNTVPGTITINEGGVVSADSASNNAHNIGALFMNGGTLTSTGAAYSEGNWIFNADVTVGGSALSTISGLKIGSKSGGGTYNVADSVAGAGTDLLVSAAMVEASGGSYLTKTGVGTMTLSGTNTYTGNTTIDAGTLSVTGAGSLGSGTYAGAIANSATLTFATSADQTLSGVISGTGALNKSSTGTLTLSNTNTYNGLTTATAGTLDVTGSIGGALTVNGGTVTTDASGSVAGALTMTTGSISPGTRTSNGTLNVTGNSTWTGGTYVWSVSGGMADSGSNASSGGSDTYNEASGTSGTDWDYMAFTGSLDFDGASAGSITIDIDSNGTYTGYDWDKATEVKIIGAASIANFDASFFNLDSSGFDDATGSWLVDWGIAHHDNALWLQYKAVPEPGTYVMIFGLVMLPIYHWRKKRKVSIRSVK